MDIISFLIVFFVGYFVGKKCCLLSKAQGLISKIIGKK
jgi:hypothetical protein